MSNDDEIFPTPDHRDKLERVKNLINAEMLTGRNPELISTEIAITEVRVVSVYVFQTLYRVFEEQLSEHPEGKLFTQ
ncbi:hypothetical protein ACTXT7_014400 [Hymenolepis weldensis]